MALSNKEIQSRYRMKIKNGELRRIELVVSKEFDDMVTYLCDSLGATRKGVILRSIQDLYFEQKRREEYRKKHFETRIARY